MTRIQRYWAKVNKKGPYPDLGKYPKIKTCCWIWTGAVDYDGYGRSYRETEQ